MANMYINYGSFDEWAQKINAKNDRLDETLKTIQKTINGLEGDWESNAAVTIREKITGMSPRFEDYHLIVNKYAEFLHITAEQYRVIDNGLKSNAERFI